MAHIFFEPLERRRSTQSLLTTFGGLNNTGAIAIYAAPVPEYAVQFPTNPWGSTIGWGTTPNLLYGINFPTYPSSGYSPWGWGGLFGNSSYSPWSNPFNSWSNPYNPWGGSSWGFNNFFSPIGGFFGGFFGGLFGGGGYPWSGGGLIPDIRLLYGVFPTPSPPTNIVTYYGITAPSSFGLW